VLSRIFTTESHRGAQRITEGSQPAGNVGGIVQQDQEAGPLNSSEAQEDARVGFDEVAEQTEGEVGDHEDFEGVAGQEVSVVLIGILRLRRSFASRNLCSAEDDNSIKDRNKGYKEGDFVELCGVAWDAVAEVDGPGECGGSAVGVVGESGEEAADASDSDAEG